ncbi:MAG: UDP-glucose 4-epimerase GalE [Nanoarchaeota archaeon]
METILVTGGAGYIGSITVKELVDKYNVIVVDNLSKGKRELVDKKAIFYEADLTNKENLQEIFKEHNINYVMHFASYKAVGESMSNAVKYSDNLIGTINLLNAMVKYNVPKIIFSSSASVYGMPNKKIIDEQTELNPINYYGFTKQEAEKIIEYYHKIHNLQYISFRYFNVAGDVLNYIDPEANNIFPIIMEVIQGKRDKLTIFGNDCPTPDGTCVRDYIHVSDLIDAHIKALKVDYNGVINLGTGKGYSVIELVNAFTELIKPFKYEFGERREGDPAFLVASNQKAKDILGWTPKKTLKEMILSTYNAYNSVS